MKIYDIAFVGMGASALGTYKLKYHNQDCSIIGIDKNFNSPRDNFFAFWMTDWMSPFKILVKNQWIKWEFYYQQQKKDSQFEVDLLLQSVHQYLGY